MVLFSLYLCCSLSWISIQDILLCFFPKSFDALDFTNLFHFISSLALIFDVGIYIYWHGFVAVVVVVCWWLVIIRTDKDTYRNVVNIYEFSQPFTSVKYPNENFLIRIELALIWDEIKITTISYRWVLLHNFELPFQAHSNARLRVSNEEQSFRLENISHLVSIIKKKHEPILR